MLESRETALALAIVSLFVAGFAFAGDDPVEAIQATSEIPEDRLLDVGIRLFETGIPEDEYARYLLEEKGVYEDVRKSEARYIPILLKRTLESTGFWGAVRVVPDANAVDVVVDGVIVESNGKKLELDVLVTDATGKSWFTRRYKGEADPLAYVPENAGREPFQSLYNEIANDLLEKRNGLESDDFVAIRRVAQLKFATDLAPSAFEGYLEVKKGRYAAAKIPAEGDPMMEHLDRIRDRDHMFIDTVNEYYADLFAKMQAPYGSWRSFSYEEQVALDQLNKEKWVRILGGAAAIVGGVIVTQKTRSRVGDIGVYGGMAAVMDGLDKAEQMKMHREALKELAGSFDSEVSELLVDVEGEVLRLTGSVETQYAGWRKLLRQIFDAQMGLPLDPNADPEILITPPPPGTSKQ
jgi:hypothetical protein